MYPQTRRQREVLDFIVRHIESHGYRPSYAVIARHLGLNSRSGIARIVRDLESQGVLARHREDGHFSIAISNGNGSPRSAGVSVEWLDVPVTVENREPWQDRPLEIPEFMLGFQTSDRIRAYRIMDNSMAEEDIREDDVALIELRQFVRDGDRVVVVLNNEHALLRKYYRAGAWIELRPASPDDEVIRIAADRVEIKGVYRGLLRPVV